MKTTIAHITYFSRRVFYAILLFQLCVPISSNVYAAGKLSVIELKGCDKASACVPMLIDVKPNDKSIIIASSQDMKNSQDANGYTLFHLRFEGKVNGSSQIIEASFKGYTDGIDCTSFGQGSVGFLGYSTADNPIIASSAGPIEVTDKRLEIGCDHCVVARDTATGKIIGTFRSPGYDLTLTDAAPSDFTYDLQGGYNLKQGPMCLRIQDSSPVQSVYPERCVVPKKIKIEIEQGDCS